MNNLFCIVLVALSCAFVSSKESPPHILFIVADDLGWNDVSWNNHKMVMPTLDKMALKGVILNTSYVQPTCSPSRGAMMTGYYPFHLGMQRGVISKYQPRYLPADKETLPEALKKLGYATHMVGKWHLGFCNWKYTPTQRGFDSFYGFYSGAQDYYKHILAGGYDFRFNTSVHHPTKMRYSTTLFGKRGVEIVKNHNPNEKPLFLYMAFQGVHSPLQVPKKYSRQQHSGVQNMNRRIYNGMVTAVDSAIDNVMDELRDQGYTDNLLVVFTSDNGGASYISGSNWPLRGSKNTLWEGGTRVPTIVYSETLIKKQGRVYDGLFHATDWYPTLVRLAGGTTSPFIDGVDQWRSLSMGWPSPRTELVYNINEKKRTGAIRMGDYKLIVGSPGRYNSWYPEKILPSCKRLQKIGFRYQKEEKLLRQAEIEDRKENMKSKGGWWFSYPLSFVSAFAKNAAESAGATKMWGKMRRWYGKYQCDKSMTARKYEIKHLRPGTIHLFNIKDDPLEKFNLLERKPVLVKKMMKRLKEYKKSLVPYQNQPKTKMAHPKYHNGIWSPGWC